MYRLQTPFAAVSAQTTRFQRVRPTYEIPYIDHKREGYERAAQEREGSSKADPDTQIYQSYLDKVTPYVAYRWVGTALLFVAFGLRIIFAQGWYIGT